MPRGTPRPAPPTPRVPSRVRRGGSGNMPAVSDSTVPQPRGPAPAKRPTIKDVARLSGVTAATVSRVLNAKRNFSVSNEVRARIESVAREVGYVPDLAARNLNRRQTRIVGVFAPPGTHVAEGIYESLLEGVAGVLHRAGYDVFFQLTSGEHVAPVLPAWRFDGAIVMPAPRPETLAKLHHRGVPYVCVNESADGALFNVLADDRMGVAKCLDHLHQLGHKRLAYVNARQTYLPHYSVAMRYDGLVEGAAARGMKVVARDDAAPADAVAFLRRAIRDGATACVAYDHRLAVTTVGAATELGLRLPRDLSLICFNDVFPTAVLPTPLTAVSVNGDAMGRAGAELLLSRLESAGHGQNGRAGPAKSEPPAGLEEGLEDRVVWVPEDLVVRASTAPPPPG